MESPELGTTLDDLVSRVESGDITEEEAASEVPLGRGKTAGIAIHLSGNVAGVVQFLEDNDVTPAHVGVDYIEAFVPVRLLRQISRMTGVLYIETLVPPQPSQLPQNISGGGPSVHGSKAWNDAGFTGDGIKIGVIDLGFEGFSELMGTELPATVQAMCYGTEINENQGLGSCGGGSSHGTAVAESIIDIAPEASLYLGAVRTKGQLDKTVDWMISEGVAVINMSLGWTFDGPGDGSARSESSPLNALDRAVTAGIVWVNSAGNDARKTWFGTPTDLDGDGILEFTGGTELLAVSSGRQVQIRWQGSWGGQTLDLDLYLYDSDGRVIKRSFNPQKGGAGHNPYERVWQWGGGTSLLQVGNRSGSLPDWLQVTVWGSALEGSTSNGSITNPGESANAGMLTVGAADWARPESIESFSSRGATPDGRLKPDVVGADCGQTTTSDRFCGTSQASPHLAGMAALVRQRFPSYTPQQVVQYLTENAQDRGAPGHDNTWGAGFAVLPPLPEQMTASSDRDALVALYNATDGPNWTDNTNWLSAKPIGEWHGVTTHEDGRVSTLSLSENGLSGWMPLELGTLTRLGVLSLHRNQLTGPIPPELGNLANLGSLELQFNQLSGRIPPELGNLANLRGLVLNSNELSGPIPPELGNLANLFGLTLHSNHLRGPLPDSFTGLHALEHLSWYDTELCAPTDAAFQGWLSGVSIRNGENCAATTSPDRDVLVALYNATDGPNWLDNTKWLSDRPIGEWVGVTTNENGRVTELLLGETGLSGRIPPELGNLANLESLVLHGNQLSGRIPPELGNLANLREMWLFDNQLSGPLPDSFTGLDALGSLHWIDTELCAPTDAAFQAWLSGVRDTNGEDCAAAGSPDRDVLVALYNATDGPNWLDNTKWLSDRPVGEWYGVTTDGSGRVTELRLGENLLSGRIPPALANLARLRVLLLHRNQLSGPIPPELGNLYDLHDLWLTSNQLSGRIPTELGNLASLQSLALDGNQLSGPIPAELGNLANLQGLSLDNNELSGQIPAELGNLANLQGLWLHFNQLSGPLPDSFTALDVLEFLWWYDTQLCAPTDAAFQAWLRGVPDTNGENCASPASPDRAALVALYNATNGPNWNNNFNWLSDRPIGEWHGVTTDGSGRVTDLLLDSNGLNGSIPVELGNLASLQRLWLNQNQLSGPIPPELDRLSDLNVLELGGNRLSGRIPVELGNLANLRLLDLGSNELSGSIPPELGSLSSLRALGLNHNELSGTIPPELGNLANLEELWLQFNQLSGPLPDSFTGLDELEHLHWYGTELCAPTNAAFQAWLSGVDNILGENCAAAAFPDRDVLVALYNATGGPNWYENTNWLSDEPIGEWRGVTTDGSGRVTALFLTHNELNGQIPPELGNLTSLQELDLSWNELSRRIPPELGNLANLQDMRLDGNELSGRIPAELGNLPNLQELGLSSNQLSGPLPAELGNLANLQRLGLGVNQLSGPLPNSFTGLHALDSLTWHDTGLCAPTDAAFQAWLSGVEHTSGQNCAAASDRDALVALYNATNGDAWEENGNWLSGEPIGEWYGVTTDESGRVTGLDLRNNDLSGDLPTGLGDLSELEELELWGNSIYGEIPSILGNLSRLRVLDLGGNLIGGEIPSELGNLDALETLYLSGDLHNLTGCIPEGLRDVPSNDFESLGLPYCDAAATSDRDALVALYNATDGPNWAYKTNWLSDRPIGEWAGVTTDADGRVTRLQLDNNHQLSGTIPSEIGSLTNLQWLELSHGQLTGGIPPELGNLNNLQELRLNDSQLTGGIPRELGSLNNLQMLDLSGNQLMGAVPSGLSGLANLEVLWLNYNSSLSGPLPLDLSRLINLQALVLRGTQLCAPRDEAFQAWLAGVNKSGVVNCPEATSGDRDVLMALYNATDGPNWTNNTNWLSDKPIGEWYGVTTDGSGRVTELSLRFNANMAGELPSKLGDLARLEVLWLDSNSLSGEIPPELGNLTNLEWLALSYNQLSGEIPAELGSLANLQTLRLDHNLFTGEVPAELGRLIQLESLPLRGNSGLSGPLPGAFTSLDALQWLSLNNTHLCAPTDSAFQAWLRGVSTRHGVENCAEPASNDYDNDDDGLIEVANLAQLNAIRWDLDGDGTPSSNAAGYNAAFPNTTAGMGCPAGGCTGYELTANLDLDTNGSGSPDPGDAYWNEGLGWEPIGDDSNPFVSSFNGGGHTISNLYIDRGDAEYVGLFGKADWDGSNRFVGLNNNIRTVGLLNVDVNGGLYTGGLVGHNAAIVAASYVTGNVSGWLNVGGLVGSNFSGTIIASYSTASVAGGSDVGGLVGSNFSGIIIASYSTASVAGGSDVGGLVGSNFGNTGEATDSYWDTQTSGQSESAGGEGKTTSELQSPTGYIGIYENWNLDLDDDGEGDDQWDFGASSQYPRLRNVGAR